MRDRAQRATSPGELGMLAVEAFISDNVLQNRGTPMKSARDSLAARFTPLVQAMPALGIPLPQPAQCGFPSPQQPAVVPASGASFSAGQGDQGPRAGSANFNHRAVSPQTKGRFLSPGGSPFDPPGRVGLKSPATGSKHGELPAVVLQRDSCTGHGLGESSALTAPARHTAAAYSKDPVAQQHLSPEMQNETGPGQGQAADDLQSSQTSVVGRQAAGIEEVVPEVKQEVLAADPALEAPQKQGKIAPDDGSPASRKTIHYSFINSRDRHATQFHAASQGGYSSPPQEKQNAGPAQATGRSSTLKGILPSVKPSSASPATSPFRTMHPSGVPSHPLRTPPDGQNPVQPIPKPLTPPPKPLSPQTSPHPKLSQQNKEQSRGSGWRMVEDADTDAQQPFTKSTAKAGRVQHDPTAAAESGASLVDNAESPFSHAR